MSCRRSEPQSRYRLSPSVGWTGDGCADGFSGSTDAHRGVPGWTRPGPTDLVGVVFFTCCILDVRPDTLLWFSVASTALSVLFPVRSKSRRPCLFV